MRRFMLCLFVFFFILTVSPVFAADSAVLLQNSAERMLVNVNLADLQLTQAEREGTTWDVAVAADFGATSQPGAPLLPVWTKLIAVGPDEGIAVKIAAVDAVEITGINLMPAQLPVDRNATELPPFVMDEQIYAADALWPAEQVTTGKPVIIHGSRFVPVNYYPVRYNPATGELLVNESATLEITGGLVDSRNELTRALPPTPAFASALRTMSYSFNRRDQFTNWVPQDGAIMVIVYDDFVAGIAPYVEWKQKKGLTVEVVLTSEITGNAQDGEQIKQLLFNRYHDDTLPSLDYVVLVGDFEHITTLYGIGHSAADSRFVTLDGNDYFPDTIISRMVVKGPAELANIVNKVVNYEAAPQMANTDWYLKGLTVSGSDSVDDQNATFCGQILEQNGFTHVDYFFQSSWSNTLANVTNAINEGRSWISYFGHGSSSSWSSINPPMSNSAVASLANNSMLPAITSIACDNAHFDASSPCFAEMWMKASETAGASGIFAASRNTPFGWTDSLGKGVAEGYFNEGYQTFGAACYYGKMYMYKDYPEGAGGTTEEVFQHYLIFGDPELNVWSDIPAEMELSTEKFIPAGEPTLTIIVSVNETPLAGALVHGSRDGEFDAVGRTDENGSVTLDFAAPLTEGALTLFATGPNALPKEATLMVLADADDDATDDDDAAGDDDATGDDDDATGDDDDATGDDDAAGDDDDDDDDDNGCGN